MSKALLKKVTLKSIGISAPVMRENFGKPVARIIGQAVTAKEITTEYGASQRFTGKFEFTNLVTGETKTAIVAFFPRILEDMVVSALASGTAGFAVNVTSVRNDATATGYEYGVEPLLDTVDPLEAIRTQIKQISGPAKKPKAA